MNVYVLSEMSNVDNDPTWNVIGVFSTMDAGLCAFKKRLGDKVAEWAPDKLDVEKTSEEGAWYACMTADEADTFHLQLDTMEVKGGARGK